MQCNWYCTRCYFFHLIKFNVRKKKNYCAGLVFSRKIIWQSCQFSFLQIKKCREMWRRSTSVCTLLMIWFEIAFSWRATQCVKFRTKVQFREFLNFFGTERFRWGQTNEVKISKNVDFSWGYHAINHQLVNMKYPWNTGHDYVCIFTKLKKKL